MKRIDVSGNRFGRLTAISYVGESRWKCLCDCETVKVVHLQKLKSGWTKSCGCIQKEKARERQFKHGMTKTSIYRVYRGMIRRCYDENNPAFEQYGGRGIRVCDEWLDDFSSFYNDMGDRPDNMSLDRKDNNGHYSPQNCRWATRTQQNNNTRANVSYEYRGLVANQTEWARALGVTQSGFRYYVINHSPETAIEHYMLKSGLNNNDIIKILQGEAT